MRIPVSCVFSNLDYQAVGRPLLCQFDTLETRPEIVIAVLGATFQRWEDVLSDKPWTCLVNIVSVPARSAFIILGRNGTSCQSKYP